MKHGLKYITAIVCGLAVCLAACTDRQDEVAGEARLVTVSLNLDTQPMETKADNTYSRSTVPMAPELENPMKSIAVLQFDSEGTMLRVNEAEPSHPYFHYIDLTSEDSSAGLIGTQLNVELFALDDTRVCVIANVDEQTVQDLVFNDEEGRSYLWNEFRVSTIDIPYISKPDESGDKTRVGHVEEVFMYGQYEGNIDEQGMAVSGPNTKQLSIVMARIISRMEMYIRLGEEVHVPNGYKIYLGFTGIEKSAYLMPGVANYLTEYVHNHVVLPPSERTDLIKGNGTTGTTFYFYLAPHLVVQDHQDRVTKFIIWCVPYNVVSGDLINTEGEPNSQYNHAEILMCNDPLGENPNAEGSLWLNRNSLYHVNITLTYQNDTRATRAQGDGEYVINLKELIN